MIDLLYRGDTERLEGHHELALPYEVHAVTGE